MNKKLKYIFATATAAVMGMSLLASCAQPVAEHRHAIYPVAAKAATCTEQGNIAYEHCIYCGQCYLDGEEVEESAVILPIDYSNHTALEQFQGTAPTCVSSGIADYSYCADCGKYYVNGAEVTEEGIVLAADPAAHLLTTVEEVIGCNVNGMAEHQECVYCGKYFDMTGKEVTKESLETDPVGEHAWNNAGNKCTRCDAFKITYDTGKSVVIDETNHIPMNAASVGPAHGSGTDRDAALAALHEERLTFSTQRTGSTVESVNGEWKITAQKLEGTFTRFAVADAEGNPYAGKFILSFDVVSSVDAEMRRLGVKVVDSENANEITSGSYDKLIGTDSKEENNPDRAFKAGVKYRMQYIVETTDIDQLVQIWTHIGATTLTISNFHLVTLPEEAKGEVPSAKLLYFGETVTGANSLEVYGSGDFFKASDWELLAGGAGSGEAMYDENGNLCFNAETAARFNLFYVAQTLSSSSYIHIGDNGQGKVSAVDEIYGKNYSYTFEMSATGAFDMLVLGSSNAKTPAENQNGIWLSFAEDGSVALNIGSGHSERNSFGEIKAAAGGFKFGADQTNTVTVTLNRKDIASISVSLAVNGVAVTFAADTIVNADYVAIESGAAIYKGLEDTGYGQRVGFIPSGNSIVTVTGLTLPASGYFAEVAVEGGKIKDTDATSAVVEIGSQITVVADTRSGFEFEKWTVGSATSEEQSYSFTVSEAVNAVASFKKIDTGVVYEASTANPAQNIRGDEFFNVDNWTDATVTKNEDNALVFAGGTKARFDLFHVAQGTEGWVHLGDKGNDSKKIPAVIDEIGGKVYTYTFDVSATGAFDILVLGNSAAKTVTQTQYSIWLNFAADGTVTLNFGHNTGKTCWGELSYKTDFRFGADESNKVSVNLIRVDEDVLKLGVVVNGKVVEFTGTITNTSNFAFADGYLTVTGIFGGVGYGQRIGFWPAAESTVTVSGMGIGIDGVDQTVTEPEPEPETVKVMVVDGTIKDTGATEGDYEAGSKVTVVADDKPGYIFLGWYNGDELLSSEKEYEYTVSGEVTLTAKFEEQTEPETVYEATTSNSAQSIKGDEFFNTDSWTAVASDKPAKEGNNLVFTADSASRFDLFYVTTRSGGWTHLADKTGNFNGADTSLIYNREYTFTMDLSATGEFDIQLFGPSSVTKKQQGQNSLWLTFTEDGKVTIYFGSGFTGKPESWGELSADSGFEFGSDKTNKLTINVTRTDDTTLKVQLIVNGKVLAFDGTISDASHFAMDDEGVFTISNVLGANGYGQRIGFYPATDSTVTVSGMGIGIDGRDYIPE